MTNKALCLGLFYVWIFTHYQTDMTADELSPLTILYKYMIQSYLFY